MASLDTTESGLQRLLANKGFAAGLFACLAVVMTLPLALHFTSAIPFGAADIFQNYWNFWWWEKSLLQLGEHPYHTDWLFFPFGTDLIFHTNSSFNMIAAMPFTALLGPAAAYNFCVLLSLFLSGWGAYWLVLELTGDSRGAVLGGLSSPTSLNTSNRRSSTSTCFRWNLSPLRWYFSSASAVMAASAIFWVWG